jgi:hypothetical protein
MYLWIDISYKKIISSLVLSFLQYMESSHYISCKATSMDAKFLRFGLFRIPLAFGFLIFLNYFLQPYLLSCPYAIYILTKIISFLFQLLRN